MAEALSAVGERPVAYTRISLDTVAARSRNLAAMYRFLTDTGYQVDIAAVRARFPAVEWTTFAHWVDAVSASELDGTV